MESEWILNDRTIKKVQELLEACTGVLNVKVISMVLFGSKARGDRNSQNDYEFMVLVDDEIDINSYIKLENSLKLEFLKEKLFTTKIQMYTPEIFEDILYNDKTTGTFLYILCKENIILFDRYNTFCAIKERVLRSTIKDEETFLEQCIEFARIFGSEKWAQKWEKNLMQHKYLKKRRVY